MSIFPAIALAVLAMLVGGASLVLPHIARAAAPAGSGPGTVTAVTTELNVSAHYAPSFAGQTSGATASWNGVTVSANGNAAKITENSTTEAYTVPLTSE